MREAASREPCPRCNIRGDLGCAHQSKFIPPEPPRYSMGNIHGGQGENYQAKEDGRTRNGSLARHNALGGIKRNEARYNYRGVKIDKAKAAASLSPKRGPNYAGGNSAKDFGMEPVRKPRAVKLLKSEPKG